MKTYIALLRGINVGGKGILPMASLVKIFQSLGCEAVRTYIQSGNAVFKSAKPIPTLSREFRTKLLELHGFEPQTLFLEKSELQAAIAANPFDIKEGKALHCFFLAEQPKQPDLAGLKALKTKTEEFKLGKKVFYLYAPEGIGRSKLAAKVESHLGVPATARNWNTVSQLMAMADES